MSKLNLLIRKKKGKTLNSYLVDAIQSCGISFNDVNLLSLEESDELVSNIRKKFGKKKEIDELVSFDFNGQIQEIDLLTRLSNTFLNVGGYFLSDVYDYCGIYKENFSLLVEKSQCLLLKSEQGTVMIVDENLTVYITINLIEGANNQIEIQVKYL